MNIKLIIIVLFIAVIVYGKVHARKIEDGGLQEVEIKEITIAKEENVLCRSIEFTFPAYPSGFPSETDVTVYYYLKKDLVLISSSALNSYSIEDDKKVSGGCIPIGSGYHARVEFHYNQPGTLSFCPKKIIIDDVEAFLNKKVDNLFTTTCRSSEQP